MFRKVRGMVAPRTAKDSNVIDIACGTGAGVMAMFLIFVLWIFGPMTAIFTHTIYHNWAPPPVVTVGPDESVLDEKLL